MNILVINNTFFPITKATDNILFQYLKTLAKDNDITVLSKGELRHIKVDSISNYQISDLDNFYKFKGPRKIFSFIYKIIRKVFGNHVVEKIDGLRLFNKSKNLLKNNNFNLIISVSGPFCAQIAATKISKKFNLPLIIWYTDPYLFRINNKTPITKLAKIEKKWFEQANKIIMPSNYFCEYSKFYRDKFLEKMECIELPCYLDLDKFNIISNEIVTKNLIIHTGAMMYRIGENGQKLLSLLSKLKDFNIISLESKPKSKKLICPENLKFFSRISGDKYYKLIGQAEALLLVDNAYGIQIPSKTYEYLSTNKPIICIYFSSKSKTLEVLSQYKNIFYINVNNYSDSVFEEMDVFLKNYIHPVSNCVDKNTEIYTKLDNAIFKK